MYFCYDFILSAIKKVIKVHVKINNNYKKLK